MHQHHESISACRCEGFKVSYQSLGENSARKAGYRGARRSKRREKTEEELVSSWCSADVSLT